VIDFSSLKDAILAMVGNLFIAGLVIGAIPHLLRRELVRFVEFLAVALVIGSVVYTPDAYVAMGTGLGKLLGG
jgi:hypothetical protein